MRPPIDETTDSVKPVNLKELASNPAEFQKFLERFCDDANPKYLFDDEYDHLNSLKLKLQIRDPEGFSLIDYLARNADYQTLSAIIKKGLNPEIFTTEIYETKSTIEYLLSSQKESPDRNEFIKFILTQQDVPFTPQLLYCLIEKFSDLEFVSSIIAQRADVAAQCF
jgi:hypothetical protein